MTIENSSDNSKDERLKDLVVAFIFVAIGLLVFYIYFFKSGYISGNSSDWGGLGDYFNGLTSPVIGFITILLLYKTYISQKEELKATRNLLNLQLNQAATKNKKDMLWKSAESVFVEIQNVYEDKNDEIAGYLWGAEYLRNVNTAREMINENFVWRLWELQDYLCSIDLLTDNFTQSTDYFRRRINIKFRAFGEECIELNEVLGKLQPSFDKDGFKIINEMSNILD